MLSLEHFLKFASDPVVIIDHNGNLLEANENFKKLFLPNKLKKIKKLSIKHFIRLNNNKLDDLDVFHFINELEKANNHFYFQIKTSKKGVLDVEGYGIPIKNEEKQGKNIFLVIFKPITERKRLQKIIDKLNDKLEGIKELFPQFQFWNLLQTKDSVEFIKKSKQEYETIFQETPIGLINCDKDGFIININKKAIEYLNLSDNIERLPFLNILVDEPFHSTDLPEKFLKCIKEQKIFQKVITISNGFNNKTKFLDIKLIPSFNE
ncbi:MAG: PAS domain-containing protein, partial [Promethearchaeota archaeon]